MTVNDFYRKAFIYSIDKCKEELIQASFREEKIKNFTGILCNRGKQLMDCIPDIIYFFQTRKLHDKQIILKMISIINLYRKSNMVEVIKSLYGKDYFVKNYVKKVKRNGKLSVFGKINDAFAVYLKNSNDTIVLDSNKASINTINSYIIDMEDSIFSTELPTPQPIESIKSNEVKPKGIYSQIKTSHQYFTYTDYIKHQEFKVKENVKEKQTKEKNL